MRILLALVCALLSGSVLADGFWQLSSVINKTYCEPTAWACETTTTTGTGNLTLGGAVTGWEAINTRWSNDTTNAGIRFEYKIKNRSAPSEWEHGIGYLSAATTLVREEIIESSNSDAAVNLSAGAKDVIVYPWGLAGGASQLTSLSSTATGNERATFPQNYGISTGTQASLTGSDYFYPVYIGMNQTCDAFIVEATAAATANVIVGLYAVGPTDWKAQKLVQSGSVVSYSASTGLGASTFTARKFPPGWYALGISFSAASGTWRTMTGLLYDPLGVSTTLAGRKFGFSATRAYDGTLPATAGTQSFSGVTPWAIALRCQ